MEGMDYRQIVEYFDAKIQEMELYIERRGGALFLSKGEAEIYGNETKRMIQELSQEKKLRDIYNRKLLTVHP